MTYPAQTIIKDAQVVLQDLGGVRWPATELVGYLNAGQNALVQARPDQNAVVRAFEPIEGAVQTLPVDALTFIDIAGNTSGKQRSIRKVESKTLDDVDRDWHSMLPASVFVHFCHDTRFPRQFLLYPPAKPPGSGASVDLVHSVAPTPVPAAGGMPFSTVTGNIGLADNWAGALLNYVLGRAYAKDAEYGNNATKSATYLGAFASEVSGQAQIANAVKPKT